MENREQFNSALRELGFNKIKKLICEDFYANRNFNLAKRQHYWLKQKNPHKCTKLFFENLYKIGLYEESLQEFKRILNQAYFENSEIVKRLIKIGTVLNKNVGSAAIIYKLHEFSINPLSTFGKENLKSVLEIMDAEMAENFKLPFFTQFYEVDTEGNVLRAFERSYYYKYFELCKFRPKKLEEFKAKRGKVSNDDINYFIGSASANLLREAENKLRVRVGGKNIGEGYINETALFYKIKEHFPEIKVLQHGRPDFLGRQHYDIWLPQLKLAIEYQGEQHDTAVDFFGGEEAFIKNVERDNLKKHKSMQNGVTLIEVRKGYNLTEILNIIEMAKNNVC